jgi:ABC-type polar amino acid transport system ATPase subunit
MPSVLIRIFDYSLKSLGDGNGLKDVNLALSKGEAFSIETDSPDDARLLLRGMATLKPPKSGQFFYKGKELDFSDYRSLLAYKKNVGYIASDATLISNRSIHDNLMLMRYYFEDSTSIQMPEEVIELCRAFALGTGFDLRPYQLDPEQNRLFVIVRELSKNPEILLFERPREFLRTKSFETLKGVLRNLISKGLAMVFFSTDEVFTKEFSQRPISINNGRLTFERQGRRQ